MEPPLIADPGIRLVRLHTQHAVGYAAILSHPKTGHYLTESGPIDAKKAFQKIEQNMAHTDAGEAAYWAILNDADDFLGFIALHNLTQKTVAVSYGIHPDHRRKGIASAALRAVLSADAFAHQTLELATHLENEASRKLLEQEALGLTYAGIRKTSFGQRHVFVRQAFL